MDFESFLNFWEDHTFMRKDNLKQQCLFSPREIKFPSTRYQGSKAKIVDWIWENIKDLNFSTCIDLFGGTGAVAYKMKQGGKQTTYNDILRFNYYMGFALIENSNTALSSKEVEWILERHSTISYPCFIQNTFSEVYFTDTENKWIDQTLTNIKQLGDPYKFSLAFFALCQACLIKRPYNLFHRKNLYLRFAEVERSFGNKTTWDKPFEALFRFFSQEVNQSIFDNHTKNVALNFNAFDIQNNYDLVYIDTPYLSKKGTATNYHSFYHFLEGLTFYENWSEHIDYQSKHYRLKLEKNEWTDKKTIYNSFDRLFEKYQKSLIVVSYRSDGIPQESELKEMLSKYKKNVQIKYFGQYKYVLSKNSNSKEILLIGI
jgi:adenine-specific DNA-methyltransferase